MPNVHFQSALGTCEIKIEKGLFKNVPTFLKKEYPDSKFVLITDETVHELYGKKLMEHPELSKNLIISIPTGEAQKNLKTIEVCVGKMLEANMTRNDVVIGLGGGMVTDIAGFVASIYMRGIKYVAIPTTLLGMADAAIGGKTGIDFDTSEGHMKNVVGTTYLPDYIVVDPELVEHLPYKHFQNAMGEIIKYVAILDPDLIEEFEKILSACQETCSIDDGRDLVPIIEKCVNAKVRVTGKDVNETGLRRILNFGHTFGHAIESATDFKTCHGEAVAMGMVIANRIAQKLGRQKKKVGDKIENLIKRFGLKTDLPEGLSVEDLVQYIKNDKKRTGDKVNFIIVTELGKPEVVPLTPEEIVKLAANE